MNIESAWLGPRRDAAGTSAAQSVLRPRWIAGRRFVFFALVIATELLAVMAMLDILAANGLEALELAILVVFGLNFLWISLWFWTAVAGFVVEAGRLDPIGLRPRRRLRAASATALTTRTAVVMPICNEDAEAVFARMDAIYASVAATGHLDHFDFYVLSGTTQPEIADAERRQWAAFCRRRGASGRLYYWKRTERAGRKAGTVADFCRRWGALYEHMIVLDADSLMTGSLIVDLARAMEANPRAGLIQTLPRSVNQTTLFARILQFAGRLYAPIFASGISFWQVGECNYWGHNAIVRTSAFMASCGLPVLSGRPPFGGEILSHDLVEAALLRRGGWLVFFVPQLEGSYETLPSNIIDYATRDRRWCQGNLQHLKLLAVRGLHPVSRLHLLSGAFSYLASPLWLVFLVLSTAAIIETAIAGHDYFPEGHQLFPVWPISKWVETVSLFAVTLVLLFLPKLLGLALALADRDIRKACGGAFRLLLSAAVETVFLALLAPVMMALHSYFVVSLLVGRGVGWDPQNRSDRGLRAAEALSSLGVLFAAGLAWGGLILVAAPDYVWWVMPVLAGLVLAVPAAVLSSRSGAGAWARDRGLFLIPEETSPPEVLTDAARALVATREASRSAVPGDLAPADATPAEIWRPMDAQTLERWSPLRSAVRLLRGRRPESGPVSRLP